MTKTLEDLKTRQAMFYHLVYNHYPPYPAAMIEPCLAAVSAALDGDLDKAINLPEGYVTLAGKTTNDR